MIAMPNGKATKDQLRIGFAFEKGTPRSAKHAAAVPNHIKVNTQTVPFDLPVTALLARRMDRTDSLSASRFDLRRFERRAKASEIPQMASSSAGVDPGTGKTATAPSM